MIVSRQLNLVGSSPYTITKVAVGVIHQPVNYFVSAQIKAYINGTLVSQVFTAIGPSAQSFGEEIVDLFLQINCLNNPCVRTLNPGDTLLIVVDGVDT